MRRRGPRKGAEYENEYEYDFKDNGEGSEWDEYYSKVPPQSRKVAPPTIARRLLRACYVTCDM